MSVSVANDELILWTVLDQDLRWSLYQSRNDYKIKMPMAYVNPIL